MKFLIHSLLLLKFCNCLVEIPPEILTAQDAIRAEENRNIFDRFQGNSVDRTGEVTGRITGGNEAYFGQFPYQALLTMTVNRKLFYTCGGSLITYKTVLTAAHCVHPFKIFNVYLGVVDRSRAYYAETNITSNYTLPHPDYDTYAFWHDIALISLQKTTQEILNHPCNCIGVINLPVKADESVNLTGMIATVSGYGRTSDKEGVSKVLRYANTTVLDMEICVNAYGPTLINESLVCTSGTNGISSCGGDSGGPLVTYISASRRVQIALVSFGALEGCELGYPNGNTRITYYIDWINENKDMAGASSTTATPTSTLSPSKCGATNVDDFICKLEKEVESLKLSNSKLEKKVEDLELKIEEFSLLKQKLDLLDDAFSVISMVIKKIPLKEDE